MNGYLPGLEHEERRPELSQWFTDPKLAREVWRWANRYELAESVLEPAAGHGALIRPIYELPMQCKRVMAVDIDATCCEVLKGVAGRALQRFGTWSVMQADFLDERLTFVDRFDLAFMNPPYEDGKAEAFVLRSLRVAKRVVGIFKASIQHGHERFHGLWSEAMVTREVKLARRPSFGIGASGSEGGKTDFVVLEIVEAPMFGASAFERFVRVETWP